MGSERKDKIERAIEIWIARSRLPESEIRDFINKLTMLSIEELDSPIIFAEPGRNVARVMHTSRNKDAFYFPRKYLEESTEEELAFWFDYGRKFLKAHNLKTSGASTIQQDLSVLTRDYLKRPSPIADVDAIKTKLARLRG